MNACVVEIITRTEGTTTRFQAKNARLFCDEKCVEVHYIVEKDAVTLYADESSFTMERRGYTPLIMRFVPHETTSMRISGGEDGANVPLYTAEYSLIREERGFRVRLSYDLLFSAEPQHFYVTIRSEEK